ncbi:hypothetical protein MMC08_003644 [Hypocenomyce scalaris]|nr:hypothetical protein [Hypocenomyce scalaris]
MSSTAAPIPLDRFAEAITALPLSNLHFKAAEIRNSIAHLESSNSQLQPFAEEGDQDCKDAIAENEEVIGRMKERIECLKREVEGRGFVWGEEEGKEGVEGAENVNGAAADGHGEVEQGQVNGERAGDTERRGGTLGDEELARRLRERIEEDGEENGVHL